MRKSWIRFGWEGLRLTAIAALILAPGAMGGLLGPETAAASTLYDQTTGQPGGFLEGKLADDFTVPPGPPWLVRSVHVDGQGGAGSKFAWIAEPGDALPGESVPAGLTPIGSTNRVLTPLPGTDSFDIPAEPAHPLQGVALPPGHYWLTVSAKPFASPEKGEATPWAWGTQSPMNGYEALWGARSCAGDSWKPLSMCGKTGPDLRFRIDGEPMDEDLSEIRFLSRERRPAGGLSVTTAVPAEGTVTLRKVAGKGRISTKVWGFHEADHDYGFVVKVKPLGGTKAALKRGAKLKTKVAVTYTPKAFNGTEGEPRTRILSLVLKKVKGVTE